MSTARRTTTPPASSGTLDVRRETQEARRRLCTGATRAFPHQRAPVGVDSHHQDTKTPRRRGRLRFWSFLTDFGQLSREGVRAEQFGVGAHLACARAGNTSGPTGRRQAPPLRAPSSPPHLLTSGVSPAWVAGAACGRAGSVMAWCLGVLVVQAAGSRAVLEPRAQNRGDTVRVYSVATTRRARRDLRASPL